MQPNIEQNTFYLFDIHSIDDSRFQVLQVLDVSNSCAKKVPTRALIRWMALSMSTTPLFCAIDIERVQSATACILDLETQFQWLITWLYYKPVMMGYSLVTLRCATKSAMTNQRCLLRGMVFGSGPAAQLERWQQKGFFFTSWRLLSDGLSACLSKATGGPCLHKGFPRWDDRRQQWW